MKASLSALVLGFVLCSFATPVFAAYMDLSVEEFTALQHATSQAISGTTTLSQDEVTTLQHLLDAISPKNASDDVMAGIRDIQAGLASGHLTKENIQLLMSLVQRDVLSQSPPDLAPQTATPEVTPVTTVPQQWADNPQTSGNGQDAGWWSVRNAMTISVVVLVFGMLVLLLASYLIKTGHQSEEVLRIFGTVLILIITVFLVVAGYSDKQVAPVMALLGTITGYLLGKDSKPKKES